MKGHLYASLCAVSLLLFFHFETSQKYYTSVLKGAELHKEAKDKVFGTFQARDISSGKFPPYEIS